MHGRALRTSFPCERMIPISLASVESKFEPERTGSLRQPELRVLLVEDSRILGEKLIELLSENRLIHILGAVPTAAEAIAMLRSRAADAMVLDLRLSQGSGFDVLEFMATLPRRPRVIVLTNYALAEYRRRAEGLGAEHFLDKSSDFPRLPELLESMRQELPG